MGETLSEGLQRCETSGIRIMEGDVYEDVGGKGSEIAKTDQKHCLSTF